jgi:tRNA(Met) C34 N-acetyltransferase TmcA
MRVQIYEGSDKGTVLTLLSKAHTWLERDWEGLTTPSSPQAPDKQRTEKERTVRSEEQHTEEERTVRSQTRPAPPSEERKPTYVETKPPEESTKSLSFSAGDNRQRAQAILERVFVLNADMVRLDPEEVARIATDRPKYVGAYIEVADQGIEWFTSFRNVLVIP